ncbi:MAG: hypothetical protein C0478_16515 [Planctomyces sp.]|jgi:hypothetical protein|nr:hypothetical protein [Planctomyces sp.]
MPHDFLDSTPPPSPASQAPAAPPPVTGSPRFSLAKSDAREIASTVAIAGGSAALVALLELLGTFHFGTWNTFFTAVFTVAIRLLQQWSADTRNQLRLPRS